MRLRHHLDPYLDTRLIHIETEMVNFKSKWDMARFGSRNPT